MKYIKDFIRILLRILSQFPLFPKHYYCISCKRKSIFFMNYGKNYESIKNLGIVGAGLRKKVTCPFCGVNDRVRWIDWYLANKTDIYTTTSSTAILHIAPEEEISKKIRKNNHIEYTTGDINKGYADLVVDVTNMKFPDNSFNWIIINHVIEHVYDEHSAFSELKRCLKESGKILISFPISKTHKCDLGHDLRRDPSMNASIEDRVRIERFGQRDHWRLYGIDAVEHIKSFGFNVEEQKVSNFFSKNDCEKYKLIYDDTLFVLSPDSSMNRI